MAMNDKELKKIKAMMPSGATLAKLKSLVKKNKADRHPNTGTKQQLKSISSKLKDLYPVSNKDVAFLKKSMKKSKQAKSKRKKTGPGSR